MATHGGNLNHLQQLRVRALANTMAALSREERLTAPAALGGQHSVTWVMHPSIAEWTPPGVMYPPSHHRTDPPRAAGAAVGSRPFSSPRPPLPPHLPYLTGPPARLRSFCCVPRANTAGALPDPTCLRKEDSQSCQHPWGPTTRQNALQKASSPAIAPLV